MSKWYFLVVLLIIYIKGHFLSNIYPINNIRDTYDDVKLDNLTIKCLYIQNYSLYDITKLQHSLSGKRREYNYTIGSKTLIYNFCLDVTGSDYNCSDVGVGQVIIYKDGKCQRITNGINKGNTWNVEGNGNNSKITVTLNVDEKSKYIVRYILKCDPNKEKYIYPDERFKLNSVKEDGNIIYFDISSYYACPQIDFYIFLRFLDHYKYAVSIVLIVVGILLTFCGTPLLHITFFIMFSLIVTIVTIVFLIQYMIPGSCPDWVILVALVISVIVGISIGFATAKHSANLIGFICGGFAGFFLGECLAKPLGSLIQWKPTLVKWGVILICMAIMIILSIWAAKIIIIISTSFIGAYITVRGVSLFLGHFPDEFRLIDLARSGEVEEIMKLLGWQAWVYIACIILLSIIGIIVQYKLVKDEDVIKNLEEKTNKKEDERDEILIGTK